MHKFGNTKTGTEQKAENNYTDDRIKQQKRGVLVVLVRTIWKNLSVRSRALEKFFLSVLEKKKPKKTETITAELKYDISKTRADTPIMIAFGFFLPKTQIL